jgi:tRNA threonylcarbamoyladenosine biosynthesis protein TsaE
MLNHKITKQEELKYISDYLINNVLHSQKKIFFYGEVGAGKTTLVKLLCKELGVEENTSSPTFSIVNQYLTKDGEIVNHVDLYRLRDVNEVYEAGIFELLYDSDYLFVEWPEILEEFLDERFYKVKIEIHEEGERIIMLDTL